ncbi:DUF2779 domain-containing protein [Candidatus Woesearchaeota archaeon]|nr:DUF2779 domain-containing protein [Candidatus Woesearchaeota archaeon]
MPLLTKSNYIIGLSCPRHLWLKFHDSDKIQENDAQTKYLFEQGKIVGNLAKKLFPGGVDIPEDFNLNLKKTQELIKQRKTLFEAGIIAENMYARADIFVPIKDEWDIIEVKSSTSVKDDHIHDLSFQKHVYQLAGLKIRKCFILHINNTFVKNGEIVPKDFFIQKEVTKEVDKAIVGIQNRIDTMMAIINNKEPPKVNIGNGCNNELDCPSEDCWNFLPEEHVFELYRGGKKSLELFEANIRSIKDIPDECKLSDKQGIQRKCAKTGKVYINKVHIRKFLNSLTYPLHYLDFETFMTAIPIYDGTKPYQQIPFQFSLHVDNANEMKHFEFLHNSKNDPRPSFLWEMKNALGTEGSIIVYNQPFEISRLKELALAFPEYKDWIESVLKRIVDLMQPFRDFDYYSPAQKGSCSIKDVLPAVTGKSYEGLDIADGGSASVSYFEMVFKGKELRKELLEYCKMDTEGMVLIVKKLMDMITLKRLV